MTALRSSTTRETRVVTLQGSGIEGVLRITESVSSWSTTGPTQEGQFLWNEPENRVRGMTQHLGELVD
jgi:hypothetical protein